MKPYHLPSGLGGGLDFLICADWTPDQALAVVELLDDLRDRIWAHYELALFDLLREERGGSGEPLPGDHSTADDWPDEPPFSTSSIAQTSRGLNRPLFYVDSNCQPFSAIFARQISADLRSR